MHQGSGGITRRGHLCYVRNDMRLHRWNPSAEQYTLIAIAISIGVAGLATKIPLISFGSFSHMAAILVLSDLVLYVMIKLGVVKVLREG